MMNATTIMSAIAVASTGLATWAIYKWLQSRETLQKYMDTYNNMKEVQRQLVHHFGDLTYTPKLARLIPQEAEHYHKRFAVFCKTVCQKHKVPMKRILDVGCGPGGLAYHLSSDFQEVIATDTSYLMLVAGEQVKQSGMISVPFSSEGGKHISIFAFHAPDSASRNKVKFWDEDVCAMSHTYGLFNCVVVSNVLTDMHDPRTFLDNIQDYVIDGGLLIISDVYNWRNGPEEVLGEEGEYLTVSLLEKCLSPAWTLEEETDMPYFVPVCLRLAHLGNSQVTVWKKKPEI